MVLLFILNDIIISSDNFYIRKDELIMTAPILTMNLFKEKFAVCRLGKNDAIPQWSKNDIFYSVTKTMDELSIVCLENDVPHNVKHENNWRILKIQGPLDFSLIGIIAKISSILAEEKISIFALSTFDTDYILLKDNNVKNAVNILNKNNYKII